MSSSIRAVLEEKFIIDNDDILEDQLQDEPNTSIIDKLDLGKDLIGFTNLLKKFQTLQEPLYVIDKVANKDKKPIPEYDIFYLDSSKTYSLSKPLGTVSLKRHQQTSLYYMMNLENQVFKVKTVADVNDNTFTNALNTPDKSKEDATDQDDANDQEAEQDDDKSVTSTANTNISDEDTNESLTGETIHYTNIGLLCDKVGAGKSYIITSLISEKKTIEHTPLPYRNTSYGSSQIKFEAAKTLLDTNILMVPHGLVGQWEKYLQNSGLKYYVVRKAMDIYKLADDCLYGKTKVKLSTRVREDDCYVDNDKDEDDDEDAQSDTASVTSSKGKKKPAAKKATKATKAAKTKNTITPQPDNNDNDDSTSATAVDDDSENKKAAKTASKRKVTISRKTAVTDETVEPTKKDKELSDIDKIFAKESEELETKNQEHKAAKTLIAKLRGEISTLDTWIWQNRSSTTTPEYIQKSRERHELYKKSDEARKNFDKLSNEIQQLRYSLGKINSQEMRRIGKTASLNLHLNSDEIKYVKRLGHFNKQKLAQYDVILVSATFYNLLAMYINKDSYVVNRLIIDECNSVKGVNLLEIPRYFTWLVTSSIKSLMTSTGFNFTQGPANKWGYCPRVREKCILSTGFILNCVKKLYENINDNYKLFLINDPAYVEQSMKLPESLNMIIVCKDNMNIQVLNGIVSHDIMRMLNAGDVDGIVNKLECASGTENSIISMVTQRYQDDIKLKEYALQININKPNYNPKNETEGTKNLRIAIADLKNKIACIEQRVAAIESCPICYDDLENPCISPCCQTKYCFGCITMALNAKAVCPNCNDTLQLNKLILLGVRNKANEAEETAKKSKAKEKEFEEMDFDEKVDFIKRTAEEFTKYENMERIFSVINTKEKKKVLVFTEYESALNTKVVAILDKFNMTYGRLKGTGAAIDKQIKEYRDGKTDCLMINSKYFGSGTNLENTTDIIIIHKMHSDVEMQVIGRAQRFGREGSLRIWKLYYQNEMN